MTPTRPTQGKPTLTQRFFIVSALPSLLLAGGLLGFMRLELFPFAIRPLAIAAIAVGLALEDWALAMLLPLLRRGR